MLVKVVPLELDLLKLLLGQEEMLGEMPVVVKR